MINRKSAAPVQIQRQELFDVAEKYRRIQDAISGEEAIKKRGATYLPIPSSCEKHSELDAGYIAYQTRAIYYNVCKPTRDALVGQLFTPPPVVELPTGLEFLIEDANGEGLNLEQLTKQAANHVLPFGRGGFLTDFPVTDGNVTRGDIESGRFRPIIRFFEPWAIRNWRTEKIGTVHKLVMLVLDEQVEVAKTDNEFDIELELRQRVYRLTDGCVSVEVYGPEGKPIEGEKYDLCNRDRQPLDSIPFDFVGSLNNDAEVDEPPFINMANLNIAHFRNSADYEDSVYLVGQPTPVYAGLTVDWVENYFQGGKVAFGSRTSIPLPENATAMLLQAEANSLAFEAMTHKEDQMRSVGGKILDPDQKIEKREIEIKEEAANQKSVLATVKDNLQLALFAAVQRAGALIGIDVIEGEHKIELNEDFDLASLDSNETTTIMEAYDKRLVAFAEVRNHFKRAGVAMLADEEAQAAIKEDFAFVESVTAKPEPTVGNGNTQNPDQGSNN